MLGGRRRRRRRRDRRQSAQVQIDTGGDHRAAERLPRAARHRDAPRADGAPRRRARWPSPATSRRASGQDRSTTRACQATRSPPSRSASCAPAAACSRSTSAIATPRARSSTRSRFRRAPRRWAASGPSPSIRRRPRTASSTPRRSRPRDPRGPGARLSRARGRRRPHRRLRARPGRPGASTVAAIDGSPPSDRNNGHRHHRLSARNAPTRAQPARPAGLAVWRTLTSVRFAVLQISVLAVAGVIGTRAAPAAGASRCTIPPPTPSRWPRSTPSYDSLSVLGLNVGPGMVDVFERLGFFRVFSAPWFVLLLTLLVVSIVVCTLDRTPDLWRAVHRVARRPGRAVLRPAPVRSGALHARDDAAAADELREGLRRRRFQVREEIGRLSRTTSGQPSPRLRRPEPVHQAGHAVHPPRADPVPGRRRGDDGARLRDGRLRGRGPDRAGPAGGHARQPAGQEHPLRGAAPTRRLVRRLPHRPRRLPERRRRSRARSSASTTRSRSTATCSTRTRSGRPRDLDDPRRRGQLVWDGPVLLDGRARRPAAGLPDHPGLGRRPAGRARPDRRRRAAAGADRHLRRRRSRAAATSCFLRVLGLGETTRAGHDGGYAIDLERRPARTRAWSSRATPARWFIWIAYLSLITGLVLTFYFPRRRVWARLRRRAPRAGDARPIATSTSSASSAACLDDLSARLRNRPESSLATRYRATLSRD